MPIYQVKGFYSLFYPSLYLYYTFLQFFWVIGSLTNTKEIYLISQGIV